MSSIEEERQMIFSSSGMPWNRTNDIRDNPQAMELLALDPIQYEIVCSADPGQPWKEVVTNLCETVIRNRKTARPIVGYIYSPKEFSGNLGIEDLLEILKADYQINLNSVNFLILDINAERATVVPLLAPYPLAVSEVPDVHMLPDLPMPGANCMALLSLTMEVPVEDLQEACQVGQMWPDHRKLIADKVRNTPQSLTLSPEKAKENFQELHHYWLGMYNILVPAAAQSLKSGLYNTRKQITKALELIKDAFESIEPGPQKDVARFDVTRSMVMWKFSTASDICDLFFDRYAQYIECSPEDEDEGFNPDANRQIGGFFATAALLTSFLCWDLQLTRFVIKNTKWEL